MGDARVCLLYHTQDNIPIVMYALGIIVIVHHLCSSACVHKSYVPRAYVTVDTLCDIWGGG